MRLVAVVGMEVASWSGSLLAAVLASSRPEAVVEVVGSARSCDGNRSACERSSPHSNVAELVRKEHCTGVAAAQALAGSRACTAEHVLEGLAAVAVVLGILEAGTGVEAAAWQVAVVQKKLAGMVESVPVRMATAESSWCSAECVVQYHIEVDGTPSPRPASKACGKGIRGSGGWHCWLTVGGGSAPCIQAEPFAADTCSGPGFLRLLHVLQQYRPHSRPILCCRTWAHGVSYEHHVGCEHGNLARRPFG